MRLTKVRDDCLLTGDNGVEHNELSLAKNDIDHDQAVELLRKYNQLAAVVIKPNGTFNFLFIDNPDIATKMDEIIELDWGKYLPGCTRRKV